MNQNIDGKDNLKRIKGIGESIAAALNDLGIKRYAELAGYDPKHLEELLENKVPPIALRRVPPEKWIRQARQLAGEEAAESNQAEIPESATELPEFQSSEKKISKRQDWREIADFFVSFGYQGDVAGVQRLMTRVHHSQEDQPMEWDGVASEELLQWMLDQAKLSSSKNAVLSSNIEESQPELQDQEIVPQLGLYNMWVSEVRMPISTGSRREAAHLRLESDLILSGLSEEFYTQDDPLECAVDVILVDTESNQSNMLGTLSKQLPAGDESLRIQHDFPIPPVGRYQLYMIARSSTPTSLIAYRQGPVITVEPGS